MRSWFSGAVLAFVSSFTVLAFGAPAPADASRPDGAPSPSDAAGPRAPLPRVKLVAFDDGARVAGDPKTALPKSPFPGATVELFGLRGETVAFQLVLEREDEGSDPAHVSLGGLGGADIRTSVFAEGFLDVKRTSGNEKKGDDSLAFTPAAKPTPTMLGPFADALVPDGELVLSRSLRAAIWVDVEIADDAAPGMRAGHVSVVSPAGVVAEIDVNLRVIDRALPYAALPVMVYYEPEGLKRRMGGLAAEPQLRRLFHAHHVAAIRPVLTEKDLEAQIPYLTGEAFTASAGYRGAGQGRGEGIVVLGSYGDLGEPQASKMPLVEKLYTRARALGPETETVLYAVDEECKSPWPAAWRKLLDERASTKALRIGATCGEDPGAHPADVVIQLPEDLSVARMLGARERGKAVWAYNGRRPYSGAPVVDAPATDLRVNGWVAARYGIARWFYWEATSWTSYGGGKIGGDTDPFVVADSFHNKDLDHSNGDGILVYPGTQVVPGMRNYERDEVFPSVRFKNVRRGIEDVGYVRLARAVSATEADAIVARAVPVALKDAPPGSPPAFSDDARSWLDARRALLEIVLRAEPAAPAPLLAPIAVSTSPPRQAGGAVVWALVALLALASFAFGRFAVEWKRD